MRGYYIATMVTFFVSGFWHGAGWTFVVWGLINGLFVCAASWMKRHGLSWSAAVSVPLTLLGVVSLRVLFVSKRFSDALLVYKGMLNVKSLTRLPLTLQIANLGHTTTRVVLSTIFVAALLCFFAPNSRSLVNSLIDSDVMRRKRHFYASAVVCAVLLSFCVFNMSQVASFLYFQV